MPTFTKNPTAPTNNILAPLTTRFFFFHSFYCPVFCFLFAVSIARLLRHFSIWMLVSFHHCRHTKFLTPTEKNVLSTDSEFSAVVRAGAEKIMRKNHSVCVLVLWCVYQRRQINCLQNEHLHEHFSAGWENRLFQEPISVKNDESHSTYA